jgi:hypothetical protein
LPNEGLRRVGLRKAADARGRFLARRGLAEPRRGRGGLKAPLAVVETMDAISKTRPRTEKASPLDSLVPR